MYLAPRLKKIYLGQPVSYCPENPIKEERSRICRELMNRITQIACELPRHQVIPYLNLPKKDYGYNIPGEEDLK